METPWRTRQIECTNNDIALLQRFNVLFCRGKLRVQRSMVFLEASDAFLAL
jgi:hypothetical protein